MISEIESGNFGSGFAAGAVSSIVSSGVEGLGRLGSYSDSDCKTSTFATRNPDLYNAIMITSGGLSGGFSSSIAGGNFWSGVRQGIITSGLNHLAHMIEYQIERDAFAKRFNKIDPWGRPEKTLKFIMEMIDDVKDLKKAYKYGTNPEIKFANYHKAGVIAHYEDGGDYVEIYDNAFEGDSTNYRLASTLFHEFYHAYEFTYNDGFWYQYAVKTYGVLDQNSPSHLWLECKAYYYQMWLGDLSQLSVVSEYNWRAKIIGLPQR